jgi:sulfite exporter TauE/SafE
MIEVTLLSVFLLGLFGGLHCAGMCGGIVSVISAGAGRKPVGRPIPIRVVEQGIPDMPAHSPMPLTGRLISQPTRHLLAYNAGRIATYTLIGTLAGALGSATSLARNLLAIEQAMFVAANLLLIVLGLYLSGALRSLAFLEQAGTGLWRLLSPIAARLLGLRSPRGAFATGLVWGLVPCGMVYSVLIAALLSGSATQGAGLMLAFGLGTLPNLLALGWAANHGQRWLKKPGLRAMAGLLVIGFGVAGLLRLNPGEHLHGVVDACIDLFR